MTKSRQTYFGDLISACLLLSQLPCGWYKFSEKAPPSVEKAGWAFPVVGFIIGGAGASSIFITQFIGLNALGTAIIFLIITTFLSGAMHDDGLADMVDGFGGGRTADEKVLIMHDSQVGSYGVLAICISVVMRLNLLAMVCAFSISFIELTLLLSLLISISRWQILCLINFFPVSPKSKLGQLTSPPSIFQILFGLAFCVIPMILIFSTLAALTMAITAMVVSFCVGKLAMYQIKGLTGDIMGASVILAEISLLVVLVALNEILPQSLGL